MLRRTLSALVGVLLVAVWATPVLAGGWAVTTLDGLPSDLEAGRTYKIGYTIRQHGQRPFPDAKTSIRIEASDGQAHVFRAVPEGSPGHYVAEVRFPTAGEWRWEVDQNPFEPQPLGTIRVIPASGVSVQTLASEPGPSLALVLLRLTLAIAALGAVTLFAARLFASVRGTQRAGAVRDVGAVRVGE